MTRADDEQTQLSLSTFRFEDRVVEKLDTPAACSWRINKYAFETHFSSDNLLVTADPVHMANIISNLMENAVKYSGKLRAVSGVECRLHGPRAHDMKVSDDGIGIPVSEQGPGIR